MFATLVALTTNLGGADEFHLRAQGGGLYEAHHSGVDAVVGHGGDNGGKCLTGIRKHRWPSPERMYPECWARRRRHTSEAAHRLYLHVRRAALVTGPGCGSSGLSHCPYSPDFGENEFSEVPHSPVPVRPA